VAEVPVPFAGVLRGLRTEAGMTLEELAEAAGLSSRAISYLERGEVSTPRKDTVQLLADALRLTGPARAQFETAARGRRSAPRVETAAATRALPRDVDSFTGRQRELAGLEHAGADGTVSIYAIGGMAGVGKTAFAVHAAHRHASRFPGGQIFLPLHGHTPGRQPVDPADALATLLLTTGVPAAQIPAALEARTALWRDRAAGRQLLLILDDAVGSEQVLPLLPGSGPSLVLVTSRRHLSALDGARPVSLDTLPPGEAAGLLVRLSGRAGLSPLDPEAGELARLCGYLPLAIGMVARQLRHHPAWTVAGRAAEMAAAAHRAELMATENLSVATAFDLSYADLTGNQQRLFRRIGLHPGTDIDAYAAAALDGTGPAAARRGLEDLYDLYLLAEPAHGRYRMHDLIREHARALARRLDPDDDRDSATARLLDYYQHAATRANALIARQARPGLADGQPLPAQIPVLASPEQALDWARAERASLLACLDNATRTSQHTRVTTLTAGLSGLLQRDGPWTEAITRHTAAVQAARQAADRLSEANALNDLGTVRRLTGEFPAAVELHEQALGIYRQIGSALGEANAVYYLGDMRRLTGEFPAAIQAAEQALGLYRELADQLGEANALSSLGSVLQLTGDYPATAATIEQALGIYRQLGNRLGEANALNDLGTVRQLTGDYPAADHAYKEALSRYRELGYRLGEANVLLRLGDVLQLTGDLPGAVQAREQALDTYRQIGNRLGEAGALQCLGAARRLTGDHAAAAQAMDQALGIYRQIGNRHGQAETLNEKGTLHQVSGELALAQDSHQQALELARAIGSSPAEAGALAGLGRCALAAGRTAEGAAGLRQALEIFQRLGAAEATDISAELNALPYGYRLFIQAVLLQNAARACRRPAPGR
jgi:tetratricopeptide (TPR) repeat protein/transcriptional regulator with XRE-family HTH domain